MDAPTSSSYDDWARRFGGIGRLYGEAALARFQRAHVCVIGVGGVGSWAAEALARSAIGELTLIDLDHVAPSNINRQAHALTDTLGMAKVDAMAERLLQINPQLVIHRVDEFIEPDTVGQLLSTQLDYVVDAIDSLRAKAALIAWCRRHKVPVVVSGGAGGKTDPTRIVVDDLSRTTDDPMASKLRYTLRRQHGFAREGKFGVPCVFSTEPLIRPSAACDASPASGHGLNCAGFGSVMSVTAGFGLAAAAQVLRQLAQSARQG